MRSEQLKSFKMNVLGQRQAALLVGRNSREELRNLYDLSEIKKKWWAEGHAEKIDLWRDFSREVTGVDEKSDLDSYDVIKTIEDSLRDSRGFHLFLPDVEKLFYRFDIENNGHFNTELRSMYEDTSINLTIVASVGDFNGIETRKTLADYHFPFYTDCWRCINVDK